MPLSPDRGRIRRSTTSPRGYKVLCVSGLHPRAFDDVIRDTLYREYKKYGDISVRVIHEPDERVAYVYFRNFDDARDAKHSKSRIILFDKVALVEPVYENNRVSENSRSRRSTSPTHHSYRSRSPGPYRDREYSEYPSEHHRRSSRPSYRSDSRNREREDIKSRYGSSKETRSDSSSGGSKKEKFPNYLNHIPPEDDPLATRTLFTGNLELNITEEEMKRIFGRYGRLVDIDIKRPPPGTGNAYAFIRYENLDQAHHAKLELSGQYIGKFQCKIGYGKVSASSKVWIGGIGSWTNLSLLEREFDRFGAIQKIDYRKGEPYAHIYYETIEAAQAAVQEMRGFPLGGPDKRIRIDFADLEVPPGSPSPSRTQRRRRDEYPPRSSKGPGETRPFDWRPPSKLSIEENEETNEENEETCHEIQSQEQILETMSSPRKSVAVKTIGELSKDSLESSWEGGLILKNSLFPTKFHFLEGNPEIKDFLKDDDKDVPHLKITQRLRLDPSKLEDVSKRMSSSHSYAVFLASSSSSIETSTCSSSKAHQCRPLRNLVSYLKQKEAAGVISLGSSCESVLYCFPPCAFSLELLRREHPYISEEGFKDDYLVIVVVVVVAIGGGGGAAAAVAPPPPSSAPVTVSNI